MIKEVKKYELLFFVHNKEKEYPIITDFTYEKTKTEALKFAIYKATLLALKENAPVSFLDIKEVKR
jgi:hypothetical protein